MINSKPLYRTEYEAWCREAIVEGEAFYERWSDC